MNNIDDHESHPLFPSGEWEGFYTYAFGPAAARHRMSFFLNFKNGIVEGNGSDDIAAFRWRGQYDTAQLWCKMTKFYPTHTVDYNGQVDENGIWGQWSIRGFGGGGFHIWPTKQEQDEEEEVIESVELKKEKKKTVVWV